MHLIIISPPTEIDLVMLLAQPDRVSGGLTPLRLRHAGDGRPLLEDALGVALVALEEKLGLLPPAELANGLYVSRHL
jgi:hypothetical protein